MRVNADTYSTQAFVAQVVPSSAPMVRPPAVRRDWELWSVREAVGMVQVGGRDGVLRETNPPGRPPWFNRDFAFRVSPHLKDFIRFGSSSLSFSEITTLRHGFGRGGIDYVSAPEGQRFRRGDRVEFMLERPNGGLYLSRGIMVDGTAFLAVDEKGDYAFFDLHYDNGMLGRNGVQIRRILASAA